VPKGVSLEWKDSAMSGKPTYEELERRIKELERQDAERKWAEKALLVSEEQLRTFMDTMTDFFAVTDKNENLIYVNKSMTEKLGYSEEEMIGMHISRIISEESMVNFVAEVKELVEQGNLSIEATWLTRDGKEIHGEISANAIYDGKGNYTGSRGVFRDITDRKRVEESLQEAHDELELRVEQRTTELRKANEQLEKEIEERKWAEEALSEREERYRTLISEMLNGFALHEIMVDNNYKPYDYRFLEVNKAFEEMTGLQGVNIVGKTVLEVLPRIEPHWVETYGAVALTGKSVRFENYSQELGKYYEVLAYSPQEGQFATVFTDITERKRAEDALRESEARYRAVVQDQTELICRFTPDGKLSFVNDAYCRYFGKDADELIGQTFIPMIPEEDREIVKTHFASVDQDNPVLEHEHRVIPRDGKICWQRWINRGIFDKSGHMVEFQAVGRDITERKRAEEKLLKTNEALTAQARTLKELNTALKVLLERRDADKGELAGKVVSNVKELVLPYVESLKKTGLDDRQTAYTSIIESNLKEIVSPFLQQLASRHFGLTPKEIQVAGLVKQGKTTKEIAELFNVSARAVQYHRHNIRAKLGLKNQQANLGAYLSSLS
jgi:PAS domain S-box-containing protein